MKPSEAGVLARFFVKAVENPNKSKEAGRPIYDEVPYVAIQVMGSKDEHHAKVNDKHKQRFPAEWAAFERGQEQLASGTPLEQWPALGVSQIAELKALGFRRVEDIADMNDAAVQKIGMGARELKAKAAAFMESASGGAGAERFAAENEALKDEIADLRQQLADLAARVKRDEDDEPAPRKRGRPRREAAE